MLSFYAKLWPCPDYHKVKAPMKTIILAGGLGTRLQEETGSRPKPMVEIGGYPLLWHIMKIYGHQGYSNFVIALGYKGDIIKRFFLDYHALRVDFEIHLASGARRFANCSIEDWIVKLVSTGEITNTGGRLLRLGHHLDRDSFFMLTYGDGLADVNLSALEAFHHSHGRLATITAVRPPARFGVITLGEGDEVIGFDEKPSVGQGWVNGGFMMLSSKLLDMFSGDHISLERDILPSLAARGELMVWRHHGFWQCVDTLRDLRYLENAWGSGHAPWQIWNETPHPVTESSL